MIPILIEYLKALRRQKANPNQSLYDMLKLEGRPFDGENRKAVITQMEEEKKDFGKDFDNFLNTTRNTLKTKLKQKLNPPIEKMKDGNGVEIELLNLVPKEHDTQEEKDERIKKIAEAVRETNQELVDTLIAEMKHEHQGKPDAPTDDQIKEAAEKAIRNLMFTPVLGVNKVVKGATSDSAHILNTCLIICHAKDPVAEFKSYTQKQIASSMSLDTTNKNKVIIQPPSLNAKSQALLHCCEANTLEISIAGKLKEIKKQLHQENNRKKVEMANYGDTSLLKQTNPLFKEVFSAKPVTRVQSSSFNIIKTIRGKLNPYTFKEQVEIKATDAPNPVNEGAKSTAWQKGVLTSTKPDRVESGQQREKPLADHPLARPKRR